MKVDLYIVKRILPDGEVWYLGGTTFSYWSKDIKDATPVSKTGLKTLMNKERLQARGNTYELLQVSVTSVGYLRNPNNEIEELLQKESDLKTENTEYQEAGSRFKYGDAVRVRHHPDLLNSEGPWFIEEVGGSCYEGITYKILGNWISEHYVFPWKEYPW